MAVINSITVGDNTYTVGGWGEPGVYGYTPIGTIIAVMANTAPAHYLACDGSIVNIEDYPELADFFLDQFGSINYFGGDGTTTFAVPDLRGEFLRGTGTNSHTNQGSGANVGVHQNSTEINPGWFNNASGGFSFSESASATYISLIKNMDYSHNYGTRQSYVVDTNLKRAANTANNAYMSCIRPTNTSVLFCIATKNIYTNPENSYSTDEKVIGKWIDGSTIYQRVVLKNFDLPATSWYTLESAATYSIGKIISASILCGVYSSSNYGIINSITCAVNSSNNVSAYGAYAVRSCIGYILQYTKTSESE